MAADPFRLDGRVAIVTGGGGWLGAAIGRCLSRAGAAVAVVGRTAQTIGEVSDRLVADGGRAVPVCCDLGAGEAVAGMVRTVTDELGGIDILVNNAAIYPERRWTDIPEDEWDAVLATNLKACFLCARAAFPSMSERGHGRIVNLASTTFFTGFPDQAVLSYITSKGGMIGFTRALARELGGSGVTVNALAPGAFEPGPTPEDYNRWVLDHQSLKRRGVGDDVGNSVVFLAGDAASFITGQTLVVDGGMAMN